MQQYYCMFSIEVGPRLIVDLSDLGKSWTTQTFLIPAAISRKSPACPRDAI